MAAWASAIEAWAEVELRQSREALHHLALALAQMQTIGNNSFRSYFCGVYADACLRMQELTAAAETLETAFTLVQNNGERFWEAELIRLTGQLRLAESRRRC